MVSPNNCFTVYPAFYSYNLYSCSQLSVTNVCDRLTFLSRFVIKGNYGNTPRLFTVNQVRSQQQPTAQQQLQQQQRSMPSPGTPASARQSPFPAETFPPPTSPTASQFPPGPNPGAPNPSAQYRLQRTASTPSATTQLPGRLISSLKFSSSFHVATAYYEYLQRDFYIYIYIYMYVYMYMYISFCYWSRSGAFNTFDYSVNCEISFFFFHVTVICKIVLSVFAKELHVHLQRKFVQLYKY